jgi:hypothetical protein
MQRQLSLAAVGSVTWADAFNRLRGMTSEHPDMRASDAERERVAEVLREAVAEGRLQMEEFEQRLDATYKARTHGELEPLVRDLPAPGGVVAPVGQEVHRVRDVGRRRDRSARGPFRGP